MERFHLVESNSGLFGAEGVKNNFFVFFDKKVSERFHLEIGEPSGLRPGLTSFGCKNAAFGRKHQPSLLWLLFFSRADWADVLAPGPSDQAASRGLNRVFFDIFVKKFLSNFAAKIRRGSLFGGKCPGRRQGVRQFAAAPGSARRTRD